MNSKNNVPLPPKPPESRVIQTGDGAASFAFLIMMLGLLVASFFAAR